MYEPHWAQPNPTDLQEPSDPPVPDTETLLAEVGSGYPSVSYPAAQRSEEPDEESVDQTIFAGLVWP
jgi:hypothetical protein